jgi:outer membrane protein OmpA-like peptidoglycan-associated protein
MNKYPNMIVEIRSHTDCRASAAYNLKLSQNRANAAVAYLISRGISPARMTAKGYGETKPVAGNSSEDGRKQNRRTEFLILP